MLKKEDLSNKLAIIDLGSNTFHLLIVKGQRISKNWIELFRQRKYVYLAKDGIQHFSEETLGRAIKALSEFKAKCQNYNVDKIVAIGTAALRSADNSQEFLGRVKSTLDIDIKIISGEEEAELIFKGLSITPTAMDVHHLNMDIGGGSVEFIVSKNNKIEFFKSFDIGISVLKNEFRSRSHSHDENLNLILKHLDIRLLDFVKSIQPYEPQTLIGASGPFEILESLKQLKAKKKGNRFDRQYVFSVANEIMRRTLEGRLSYPNMPQKRADLSFESFTLIYYILNQFPTIDNVLVSPYSLKEGVILDHI